MFTEKSDFDNIFIWKIIIIIEGGGGGGGGGLPKKGEGGQFPDLSNGEGWGYG